MEQTISLVDALTGVDIKIDNIDGTSFRVATEEGEVIKPGDKKIIPEKGLPFYQTPYKFGNLVLEFTVEFPKSLTKNQLSILRSTLKKAAKEDDISAFMEDDAILMKRFSNSTANPDVHGGKEFRDIEED